jgi:hypothetical protein
MLAENNSAASLAAQECLKAHQDSDLEAYSAELTPLLRKFISQSAEPPLFVKKK